MSVLSSGPLLERSPQEAAGSPPGRLRLCLVSADNPTGAQAARGVGGIGTHTLTLAHAIAGLGHEVTFLTESGAGPARYVDGGVEVVALAGGAGRMWKLGRWLPVPWIRRSCAAWAAIRRLQREHRFHVVSFPDGYGEGWAFSHAPLAPFAVHLYGPASMVQRWDGRAIPSVRARVEEWMERRPAATASLVICSTRRYAELFARAWSLDEARIRIIRNPLDTRLFRPAESREAARRPTIMFAGHIQRLKGVETLAAAIPRVLARHPEAEFWFVGNDTRSAPGGASMRQSLARRLGEQGVVGHVRFFGPVPQRDLVPFYQRCTLFVLPSLRDVYPNVVLEAMACGRPCVVTSSTGVAELISHGTTGFLVPPESGHVLAETICTVLDMSPSAREEMGGRARIAVEESCSASSVAARTVDAYREVVRTRCGVGGRVPVGGRA